MPALTSEYAGQFQGAPPAEGEGGSTGGGETHDEEEGGEEGEEEANPDSVAAPQRDREAARADREQARAAQRAEDEARRDARRAEADARRAAGRADAEARRAALPEQLQGPAAGQDLAPATRPRRAPKPIDRLIERP